MKKKLFKETSDLSVRLKNRNDINLKTPFCGTSLNIISDFWLITLTVQLYFFIATLKVWIYYNLQWLHTLCIFINTPVDATQWVCTNKKNVKSKCLSLFLQCLVYFDVTSISDQDRISPKNLNTIPSRWVMWRKKNVNNGSISLSNSKFFVQTSQELYGIQ